MASPVCREVFWYTSVIVYSWIAHVGVPKQTGFANFKFVPAPEILPCQLFCIHPDGAAILLDIIRILKNFVGILLRIDTKFVVLYNIGLCRLSKTWL